MVDVDPAAAGVEQKEKDEGEDEGEEARSVSLSSTPGASSSDPAPLGDASGEEPQDEVYDPDESSIGVDGDADPAEMEEDPEEEEDRKRTNVVSHLRCVFEDVRENTGMLYERMDSTRFVSFFGLVFCTSVRPYVCRSTQDVEPATSAHEMGDIIATDAPLTPFPDLVSAATAFVHETTPAASGPDEISTDEVGAAAFDTSGAGDLFNTMEGHASSTASSSTTSSSSTVSHPTAASSSSSTPSSSSAVPPPPPPPPPGPAFAVVRPGATGVAVAVLVTPQRRFNFCIQLFPPTQRFMEARCRNICHGICRKTLKTSPYAGKGPSRPAQGRPLGYLAAWLSLDAPCHASHLSLIPTYDQRCAARTAIENMGTAASILMLQQERPRDLLIEGQEPLIF